MSRRASLALFLAVGLTAVFAGAASGAHHEAPSDKPAAAGKPPPAAGGALEVWGVVVNGTLNRPAPAGLEVRLVAIDGENVRTLGVTKTDGSGRFAFPGVKAPEAGKGHFLTVTQYRGVPYMTLAPPGGKEGRLLVFELTGDPSGMRVEAHRLWVRYEEGRLIFRESIHLVNTGASTFVAEGGETLSFSLPAGAEMLQPPSGLNPQAVRMRPGSVHSSDPLPPGLRQVELVYAISDPPAQLPVEKSFQFSTKQFQVMVPEIGMRLPSPSDLNYQGVFGEDVGNRVHLASKADLPAGARVQFTLSRDVESRFSEPLFLGIVAVVVLGLAVPIALRRRRRRLARLGAGRRGGRASGAEEMRAPAAAVLPKSETMRPPSSEPAPHPSDGTEARTTDLVQERGELLAQIAALDDEWQAGQVPKEAYGARRTELKRRALEISRKMKGQ
ncbi:MAG: hypothetical protein ACE5JS_14005 [Nitrospinota bacterium]